MSFHQVIKNDSIASGASTSAGVDLGAYYPNVSVFVPTMSTGVSLNVQHSIDAGSNYYVMYHPPINSATVAINPVVISVTVGTGGGFVRLPFGGQCFRFVGAAVVSGGVALKVIGQN